MGGGMAALAPGSASATFYIITLARSAVILE